MVDTNMDQVLPDFVKNEILEVVRGELSGAVHISLSDRLRQELSEVVKGSVLEILGDKTSRVVQYGIQRTSGAGDLEDHAPSRKVCSTCEKCTMH